MAANPALVRTYQGELVPAPYPQEVFVLKRSGMQLELDGVHTSNGKWSAKGMLYISNIRMVFIADKPDASGLSCFDFPLVYLRNDVLVQPIFACNHLKGQIWPAIPGGGPAGQLPPYEFRFNFKEGGIGTFYPLYYTLATRAKQAAEAASAARTRGNIEANPANDTKQLVSQAFVDPADPSRIILTQPTDDSQRLPAPPKYAANYGDDEVYEPMDNRPRQ